MQSALCYLVHDLKHWYNSIPRLCKHAWGPIQRYHQNFTEVSLTSKLCYLSTSKLCIYTDYIVAFRNNDWMYCIQKLNNGQYLVNKKCLSVKYGFKCAKQPLGSLHCLYYVCEHLRTCKQYKVNREDVSRHYFIYLYSFTILHCLIFFIASVS
jgi:hypothetical protein